MIVMQNSIWQKNWPSSVDLALAT